MAGTGESDATEHKAGSSGMQIQKIALCLTGAGFSPFQSLTLCSTRCRLDPS